MNNNPYTNTIPNENIGERVSFYKKPLLKKGIFSVKNFPNNHNKIKIRNPIKFKVSKGIYQTNNTLVKDNFIKETNNKNQNQIKKTISNLDEILNIQNFNYFKNKTPSVYYLSNVNSINLINNNSPPKFEDTNIDLKNNSISKMNKNLMELKKKKEYVNNNNDNNKNKNLNEENIYNNKKDNKIEGNRNSLGFNSEELGKIGKFLNEV